MAIIRLKDFKPSFDFHHKCILCEKEELTPRATPALVIPLGGKWNESTLGEIVGEEVITRIANKYEYYFYCATCRLGCSYTTELKAVVKARGWKKWLR